MFCKGNLFNKPEELIKRYGFERALNKIDGEYTIVYNNGSRVYAARDLLGVMPLFYLVKNGLRISLLRKERYAELNPREFIIYDGKLNLVKRNFFSLEPEVKDKDIPEKLSEILVKAVKKRASGNVAVLFSGGIDSVIIAFILKKLGVKFRCYNVGFFRAGLKEPPDYTSALKLRKEFDIRFVRVGLKEVETAVGSIVRILGESNPVNVSIALPEYFGCKAIASDGFNVVFTGLGSEEIFGGYKRHADADDINKECLRGLKDMYLKDTYRDFAVTNHFKLKAQVPFLDREIVDYALRIPGELKINNGVKKYVLRKAALYLGVPEEYAFRKKVAAQYGSRFMKALRIVSGNKVKLYLKSLLKKGKNL